MSCELRMDALVFDKIEFHRQGMKADSELELDISVKIGKHKEEPRSKRVIVELKGIKEEEYTFLVQASGFFDYSGEAEDPLIRQNAVAIMMPYLRSEITLLTAQPGIEPIVLRPFNIVELLKNSQDE